MMRLFPQTDMDTDLRRLGPSACARQGDGSTTRIHPQNTPLMVGLSLKFKNYPNPEEVSSRPSDSQDTGFLKTD
jgi:hypothetical protein